MGYPAILRRVCVLFLFKQEFSELASVLKFACYPREGEPAPDLRGAHLVGIDSVPARADLRVSGNTVTCEPRGQEPLGLSVLWPVEGHGTVQLQTTRLPLREEPYHLHVELVRHRLMRISVKREEWGLFDYPGIEEAAAKIERARSLFLEALQLADDAPAAARVADRALALALTASEDLCRFHASVFIARRRQAGGFSRGFLGYGPGHYSLSRGRAGRGGKAGYRADREGA